MRILIAAVLVAAAGCGGGNAPLEAGRPQKATPRPTVSPQPVKLSAAGTFRPWSEGVDDIAYDEKLVPRDARATVSVASFAGGTVSSFSVHGLLPGRDYGVHLHVNPCGRDPKAAGPHFQHKADPHPHQGMSVDPAYANPRNEVWLDVRTDENGEAATTASQDWPLKADRIPRALVIHAEKTRTRKGEAGMAGARVACMTLTPS
ncbi:superoxide dismutase family protein [Bailinhaonella thermotolerans]|uniref:Superoxide dismutase family protein n=1 Tax=Bailinhaonella thermotolerans TaxID=1070861 RepID=A0A3A4AMP9_9ACTN|nr:superoxide dismutase family protein [Bailinhaonella thermotolerans]RJL30956.1 superoxide dismutase family protein [Bailinhaonella thermotolerans]